MKEAPNGAFFMRYTLRTSTAWIGAKSSESRFSSLQKSEGPDEPALFAVSRGTWVAASGAAWLLQAALNHPSKRKFSAENFQLPGDH